ncbi:MAG: TIGR00289 family protein [Methanobacteriaceae archaeon]|nr:TIGR00289 family protein [Methanobacteriaceae archaeon]
MKSAVLFSGGKDSTMALNYSISHGDEVLYLLSMKSENPESYMFHVPNIDLTDLISEAVGIPLIKGKSSGIKEKELDDLKRELVNLKDLGVEVVYTGALFSEYQRSRIDKLTKEVGLDCVSPFWHMDPEEYMNLVISSGFDVIICGVFAYGLDESWLGKHITIESLEELKKINKKCQINIAFEGGEAETFVLDGPIFNKRIKILEAENDWHIDNGTYNIINATLEDKV